MPLPVVTTEEDFQLWAHGFVLSATLHHSQRVLEVLLAAPDSNLDQLTAATSANSGHLAVMLRTLSTLGWVVRSPLGTYSTRKSVVAAASSSLLATLNEHIYGTDDGSRDSNDTVWGDQLPKLARWLPSIENGWGLPDEAQKVPLLPTMLSGAVIAPLLLELHMMSKAMATDDSVEETALDFLGGRDKKDINLAEVDNATAELIGSFFAYQQWGTYIDSTKLLRLNEVGLSVIERSPAFGVCLAYRPMLRQLEEACFGVSATVFSFTDDHERWVKRELSLVASSFLYTEYYASMISSHLDRLFDQTPLESQPSVVANVGCGDGTFLKAIYSYVKEHTMRGQQLDQRPLTMCGSTFNRDTDRDSLIQTGITLGAANVPHVMVFGDINDPISMQKELEAKLQVSLDDVLHVRSYLDHDRPFVPPTKQVDPLVRKALDASDAAYVSNAAGFGGVLVLPSEAFYSLVEHFERWAACIGTHGMLMLEASQLDVVASRRFMREASSVHFDCVQAHSGQIRLPATQVLLGAATNGLLLEEEVQTFPKSSPYTQVVLKHVSPAWMSIRLVTLDDLPVLLQLEECKEDTAARSSESVLRQRIEAHPMGQFGAVASNGQLLGVAYSQRVATLQSLASTTREAELELHNPSGPVIQLLDLVSTSVGVDSRLRRFVLHLGQLDASVERACSIERCLRYNASADASQKSYQAYVNERRDPGLLVHTQAGAFIDDVVAGYMPSDSQNLGCGVIVTYEFRDDGLRAREDLARAARGSQIKCCSSEELLAVILDILCTLTAKEHVAPSVPIMDSGIDSTTVSEFADELERRTGLKITPMTVFEHGTAEALASFLMPLDAGQPWEAVSRRARPTGQDALTVGHVTHRWPGGCSNPESFSELMQGSGDALSGVPAQRWVLEQEVDVTSLSKSQLTCIQHGGYIEAEWFDGGFFGIASAEVIWMDPHQRLVLEAGYQSLHACGLRKKDLLGSDLGHFLGMSKADWSRFQFARRGGYANYSVYATTCDSNTVASGRLSFALGMNGPCETIDTACSSGLVALQNAGLMVQANECDAAVVTAVRLELTLQHTLDAAFASMLSLSGRCFTLDQRANGYVSCEAVCTTILEVSLDESGSSVPAFAFVRGAVRCDGRSASLTAPSGKAQAAMLSAANADTTDLHRIELHGTGTALGDPTETGSLASIMAGREDDLITVGGAKASFGHTMPVSGLLGLSKMMLQLKGLACEANTQLRVLNPLVGESIGRLREVARLPTQTFFNALRSTQSTGGINSFGFSGTIAHALVSYVNERQSAYSFPFQVASFAQYARVRCPWVQSASASEQPAATGSTPLVFYRVFWARSPDSSSVQRQCPEIHWLVVESEEQLMDVEGERHVARVAMARLAGCGAAELRSVQTWHGVALLFGGEKHAGPSLAGMNATVQIVRRLSELQASMRMVIVNLGAVQVGSETLPPRISACAHRGSTGLLYSIRKEHPTLPATCLEVATATPMPCSLLDQCTETANTEWSVAHSDSGRFARRLRRTVGGKLAPAPPLGARRRFLITGGLGGLGLRTGTLLVKAGSEVTLSSRRCAAILIIVPRVSQNPNTFLLSY